MLTYALIVFAIAAGGLDRFGPLHVPLAHRHHPHSHEAIPAAT